MGVTVVLPGRRSERAFNVLELMLILAILLVFVALLLPFIVPRKHPPRSMGCMQNLKQVSLAFQLWANDNGNVFPMQTFTNAPGEPKFANASECFRYFQILSNELSTPKVLICPPDARRSATNFNSDFDNSRISYFIGMDATASNPHSLLTGDNHLTNATPLANGVMLFPSNRPAWWPQGRHNDRGNVALSDGSVELISAKQITARLTASGRATNRVLFP